MESWPIIKKQQQDTYCKLVFHGKTLGKSANDFLVDQVGSFFNIHKKNISTSPSMYSAINAVFNYHGLTAGDEVIMPATIDKMVYDIVVSFDATPVFVDITPHTFTMNPFLLESKLNVNTKLVLVSHSFYQIADMIHLKAIVGPIPLIEIVDGSFGCRQNNCFAGCLATTSCISIDDICGGAIIVNEDGLIEDYEPLSQLQSGMLYVLLLDMQENIARGHSIGNILTSTLSDLPAILPVDTGKAATNWMNYHIVLPNMSSVQRDVVLMKLSTTITPITRVSQMPLPYEVDDKCSDYQIARSILSKSILLGDTRNPLPTWTWEEAHDIGKQVKTIIKEVMND
jgi:dTDP-4-amino-4,6-dideoxygalactose transaminase